MEMAKPMPRVAIFTILNRRSDEKNMNEAEHGKKGSQIEHTPAEKVFSNFTESFAGAAHA
jgi:hypothetical protein